MKSQKAANYLIGYCLFSDINSPLDSLHWPRWGRKSGDAVSPQVPSEVGSAGAEARSGTRRAKTGRGRGPERERDLDQERGSLRSIVKMENR